MAPVVDAFRDELDQIQSIFATCAGHRSVTGFRMPYVPTEDGCLVSLWDAWNRFVRALVLTSCSGPVQGLSGNVYAPGTALTESAALASIRAGAKGTKVRVVAGEPKWFDIGAIADVTQLVGLTNDTIIVSAFTAYQVRLGGFFIQNPLEEIRVCRNLVAHKCAAALAEVRAVAGPQFTDLRTHIRSRRFGVETFSEWTEGCIAIAEAASQ